MAQKLILLSLNVREKIIFEFLDRAYLAMYLSIKISLILVT